MGRQRVRQIAGSFHNERELDRRARRHWDELNPAQQRQTVLDMIDGGQHEYVVATATRLSIEQVRAIISERGNTA